MKAGKRTLACEQGFFLYIVVVMRVYAYGNAVVLLQPANQSCTYVRT